MSSTILMTAYAVNPFKGSEDGTGWNYIVQAARQHSVIAITRKNNREPIESYIAQHPNEVYDKIRFCYFDLPYWMRFWKKGNMGALLYFYLWQLFMPLFILRRKLLFDIAHNLNFHNDWIPTFLWVFGKPLIWGPIGHHPRIPKEYLIQMYGYRAFVIDRANHFIKTIVRRLDPFMYIALWKSNLILAVNSKTVAQYPWVRHKIVVFPAIGGTAQIPQVHTNTPAFIVFSAGRFEPIKGFDIAIRSYNKFFQKLTEEERLMVSFQIAGSGAYQAMLSTLANECEQPSTIQFLSWIPKKDIPENYRNASVFFFPSHEGAGMVIPEALSFGLPVICFDNAGPGESTDHHSALKVPYTTYEQSVESFSHYLLMLFRSEKIRNNMRESALLRFNNLFEWNQKGDRLHVLYNQLGAI